MLTNTDNLVYYLDNINIEIEYDKLLTKDEVSRNNVLYDWESVKSKAKRIYKSIWI